MYTNINIILTSLIGTESSPFIRNCTLDRDWSVNLSVQDRVESISRMNIETAKKLYIQDLQNILRKSIQQTQEFAFQTRDRDDIPYIFKWEKLLHKQALGLQKKYPDSIKVALWILFGRYAREFKNLVNITKDSLTSYQYCYTSGWDLMIPFTQFDITFLPEEFMKRMENIDPMILAEVLSPFIFEIESSIAYYELLSSITQVWNEVTSFGQGLREQLNMIRLKTWKKIILLATSNKKFQSIKELEFGVPWISQLDSKIIMQKSWFDGLFWPDDFVSYFNSLDWWIGSDVIFYVRASTDASELKEGWEKSSNLLENELYRQFIKDNTITANIDAPMSDFPINDTKKYMKNMSLGYSFNSLDEVISSEAMERIISGKNLDTFSGNFYTNELEQYLLAIWIDADIISSWKLTFRCKPMEGSYGAYGHVRLRIQDTKSRKKLKDAMRWWKSYVLQVEIPAVLIKNSATNEEFRAIDRVFMSMDGEGNVRFLEGFINAIPADNDEALKNNIHGSKLTQYGKIS